MYVVFVTNYIYFVSFSGLCKHIYHQLYLRGVAIVILCSYSVIGSPSLAVTWFHLFPHWLCFCVSMCFIERQEERKRQVFIITSKEKNIKWSKWAASCLSPSCHFAFVFFFSCFFMPPLFCYAWYTLTTLHVSSQCHTFSHTYANLYNCMSSMWHFRNYLAQHVCPTISFIGHIVNLHLVTVWQMCVCSVHNSGI